MGIREIDDLIKTLISQILKFCTIEVDKAAYNKTYPGQVLDVMDGNLYRILVNHAEYKIECKDYILQKNDLVWVTAPCNDMSMIYISGKKKAK